MNELNPIDASSLRGEAAIQSTTKYPRILLIFLVLIGAGAWYGYTLTNPSRNFVSGTLVEIPEGASLTAIASILKEKEIIQSPLYFSLLVTNSGSEKRIASGMYLFKEPQDVFAVAERFALGVHGIDTLKITLPEGLSIKEMSNILAKQLSSFDNAVFLQMSEGKEGYLFPDTYFFFTTATSGDVYLTLSNNFNKKTASLLGSTTRAGKNWPKIVIMASLIEGEAVSHEDRQIVSGILWKRLEKGMRLGVDAPFMYIMGKGSLELTLNDLATSSPFNTYRNSGLPPTPINNPGLDALEAALYPSTTPYLYYLSDKDGKIHYARNFTQHKLNKEKYLR